MVRKFVAFVLIACLLVTSMPQNVSARDMSDFEPSAGEKAATVLQIVLVLGAVAGVLCLIGLNQEQIVKEQQAEKDSLQAIEEEKKTQWLLTNYKSAEEAKSKGNYLESAKKYFYLVRYIKDTKSISDTFLTQNAIPNHSALKDSMSKTITLAWANDSLLKAIDSLRKRKAKLKEEVKIVTNQIKTENASCKSLFIRGEVLDVVGSNVRIYGTAEPVFYALGERHEIYPDDFPLEKIPGIIVEASTLTLQPYKPRLRLTGNAIVGSRIAVLGYCYNNRSQGVNAFGGAATIRNYKPCSCSSKMLKLFGKRLLMIAEIQSIPNKISDKWGKTGLIDNRNTHLQFEKIYNPKMYKAYGDMF